MYSDDTPKWMREAGIVEGQNFRQQAELWRAVVLAILAFKAAQWLWPIALWTGKATYVCLLWLANGMLPVAGLCWRLSGRAVSTLIRWVGDARQRCRDIAEEVNRQRALRALAGTAVMESDRVGSEYTTVPEAARAHVFAVYQAWDKDVKTHVGSAFKVTIKQKHYLVTAGHVIARDHDSWVCTPAGAFRLASAEWVRLDVDVAVLPLQSKKLEPLTKLPSLRIGSAVPCEVYVTSAHKLNNTSFGYLRLPIGDEKHSVARGKVVYNGSTRAGFSGSPYTVGSVVQGLHLQGGILNTGYSMSYVEALIARAFRDESSDLAQVSEILKSARFADVETYWNMDECHVRVGGKYWILDEDEYNQLHEDDRYARFFVPETEGGNLRLKRPEGVKFEDRMVNESQEPTNDLLAQLLSKVDQLSTELGKVREEQKEALEEIKFSFLGQLGAIQEESARQISLMKESLNRTDSLKVDMLSTQNTLTLAQETMHGLELTQKRLADRLACIEPLVLRLESISSPSPMVNTLPSSDESRPATPTVSTALPPLEVKVTASTSTSSSEPLIQKVQRDSGPLRDSPQLETPSAGTASNLQRLIEFCASSNMQSPGFAALRNDYLLNELGLSEEAALSLIKSYRNRKTAQQKKRVRAGRLGQQTSSSS